PRGGRSGEPSFRPGPEKETGASIGSAESSPHLAPPRLSPVSRRSVPPWPARPPSPHGLGCGGGSFRGPRTGKGRPSGRTTAPAASRDVTRRGTPPAPGIPPPPALSARRRAAAPAARGALGAGSEAPG